MNQQIERIPAQQQPGEILAVLRQMDVGDKVILPCKTARLARYFLDYVRGDKFFQAKTIATGVLVLRLE